MVSSPSVFPRLTAHRDVVTIRRNETPERGDDHGHDIGARRHGKTGRRGRAAAARRPHPIGSRSASAVRLGEAGDLGLTPRVGLGVYLLLPGPAVPGAGLGAFANLVKEGVPRLVLLSGRGEEEYSTPSRSCDSGADLTIVRDVVHAELQRGLHGRLHPGRRGPVPAGDTPEPFVDADDIADGGRRAYRRQPSASSTSSPAHGSDVRDTADEISKATVAYPVRRSLSKSSRPPPTSRGSDRGRRVALVLVCRGPDGRNAHLTDNPAGAGSRVAGLQD